MDANDIQPIRDRLKDLNTKAYYLLVALSFVYCKNPTLPLKLGLTLTAVVAVLPVQDYFKSRRALNAIRGSKVALLTAALICTLVWVWCSATAAVAAAQQKTAPPPPASQAQLEARVKDLEARVNAAEQKAAIAAKELETRLNAAEQKAEITAKKERVVTLPAVLAFIAICVSSLTLWKGHFARFSPLALAGNLQHRIYPIRNEDRRWFITSFDVPVSVTNPGARPGIVTGLRLRLHYPDLPFAGNCELISAKFELKPDKVNLIDKHRFKWMNQAVAGDWSPFAILPKATVARHLLFETRWDKPVVQNRIVATLELQADRRTKWVTVTEWQLTLMPKMWVDLENGASMGYFPVKGQIPIKSDCSPPDLHKHTGTKETLPAKGTVMSAEPSYLDYPESKKD